MTDKNVLPSLIALNEQLSSKDNQQYLSSSSVRLLNLSRREVSYDSAKLNR